MKFPENSKGWALYTTAPYILLDSSNQARSQPQISKGAPTTSKGAHNLHPQKLLSNLHPSP